MKIELTEKEADNILYAVECAYSDRLIKYEDVEEAREKLLKGLGR